MNPEQPALAEQAAEGSKDKYDLSAWENLSPTDTIPELPAFALAAMMLEEVDVEAEAATASTEQLAQDVELPEDIAEELQIDMQATQSDLRAIQVELLDDLGEELGVDLVGTKIDEEMAKHFFDIEDKANDPELRDEVVQQGLKIMRSLLEGIDNYAVFASTAMYLHGTERGIDEFVEPPGDFDAVVGDVETLKRIQERLKNVPGIEFANHGKWKRLAGEAYVLSGQIRMKLKGQDGKLIDTAYPFEFFYNTFIVNDDVKKHKETIGGLNALTLEGLQKQYMENISFESKVGANTKEVATFLLQPVVKKRMLDVVKGDITDPFNRAIYDKLKLSPDDITEFYACAQKEPEDDAPQSKKDSYDSEMAILLSGFKTKMSKRRRNVEELRTAQALELNSRPDTTQSELTT